MINFGYVNENTIIGAFCCVNGVHTNSLFGTSSDDATNVDGMIY